MAEVDARERCYVAWAILAETLTRLLVEYVAEQRAKQRQAEAHAKAGSGR